MSEKDRLIKHIDVEKAYKLADIISEWGLKSLKKGVDRQDINEAVVLSLDVAKSLEVRHNDLMSIESRITDAQLTYDRMRNLYLDLKKENESLRQGFSKKLGTAFVEKESIDINKAL